MDAEYLVSCPYIAQKESPESKRRYFENIHAQEIKPSQTVTFGICFQLLVIYFKTENVSLYPHNFVF